MPSASKRVLHLHSTIEASRVMTSGPENQAPAKNGTSTPTVMLKGIFEQVAEGQNVSKKQAQDLLAGMVETMTEHLKRGDRIRINGLGTLEVRQREARTGRNPATGEMMQIAASKKVAFRPAKELKEAV